MPASWCWCALIKCKGFQEGHKPGLTAYCISETVPRETPYTKHPVPSQNEECGILTTAKQQISKAVDTDRTNEDIQINN